MLKFQIKNPSAQWFTNHNFTYSSVYSKCNDENIYLYRFPVLRYENYITLECEFMASESSGEVNVNVYDYNTRSKYAPWYYNDNEIHDKICDKIRQRIDAEAHKLDIEEIAVNT